jgi:hypothetical protein
MAKRRTRAAILEEMDKLKQQLSQVEEQEERRFGKIANKAGLLDLDISDEELLVELTDLRTRFQNPGKRPHREASGPVVTTETKVAADAIA